MGDLISWLQQHYYEHSLACFIALYVVGGKPLALVTAKVSGLDLLWLLPLVILMDAVQIPCFYYLYERVFRNVRLLRFKDFLERKGEAARSRPVFAVLSALGPLGVVLVAMLPVKGGGIWSGVLLARLLDLPKRTSFLLLMGASIFISLILVGLGEAAVSLWRTIM